MCQHRKTCNYYPKDRHRKQFNGLAQIFRESHSLTKSQCHSSYTNHLLVTDYLYNLGNAYIKIKPIKITAC